MRTALLVGFDTHRFTSLGRPLNSSCGLPIAPGAFNEVLSVSFAWFGEAVLIGSNVKYEVVL